jgi:hypothetical protein
MNASTLRTSLAITALLTLFSAQAATAQAKDGEWAKQHPRRAEVNARLAKQNKRIHTQVKEGELTKQQAQQLHQDDHQIRQEERDMAAQNGGHITKAEQRVLNRQENAVSKQIGK